jgi:hypothetical protein
MNPGGWAMNTLSDKSPFKNASKTSNCLIGQLDEIAREIMTQIVVARTTGAVCFFKVYTGLLIILFNNQPGLVMINGTIGFPLCFIHPFATYYLFICWWGH